MRLFAIETAGYSVGVCSIEALNPQFMKSLRRGGEHVQEGMQTPGNTEYAGVPLAVQMNVSSDSQASRIIELQGPLVFLNLSS
jgi:hypothetical protein